MVAGGMVPSRPAFKDFSDPEKILSWLEKAIKDLPQTTSLFPNRMHLHLASGAWVVLFMGQLDYLLTRFREMSKLASPLEKIFPNYSNLLAEPHLIQPTIIYEFPTAVSPLSKQKPGDPDWVERFEILCRWV